MKIYVYRVEVVGTAFHSEGLNHSERALNESRKGAARGWVEDKFRAARDAIRKSKKGVGKGLAKTWDWLHGLIPSDESMLTNLRLAQELAIHHPSAMTEIEARQAWNTYLRRRRISHTIWLVANLLLAPLSLLLAPFPGPNLIGYWFVFRAVSHLLALRGISVALKDRLPTAWHPSEVLDGSIKGDLDRDRLLSEVDQTSDLAA
ncbi:hypothetical protein EP7_001219 [Isosphaeraceae bacterium EP7]